jgi:hypothetical protein
MHPTLDVTRCHLDVLQLVVTLTATVGSGSLGTTTHDNSVLLVQEVGCFEISGDDEEAYGSPDKGDETFYDI